MKWHTVVDEPRAVPWLLQAADVGWTLDPFDRLLVPHARLRRWRLATADARLLKRLGAEDTVDLSSALESD